MFLGVLVQVPWRSRLVCNAVAGYVSVICTQVGMFGGTPAGGMYFGAAHGSDTHVPCSTMLGAPQAPGWPLRMQRCLLH